MYQRIESLCVDQYLGYQMKQCSLMIHLEEENSLFEDLDMIEVDIHRLHLLGMTNLLLEFVPG